MCFICYETLLDFLRFKERFEDAILRGNDKNATEREKRIGSEIAKVMILYVWHWTSYIYFYLLILFSINFMMLRTPNNFVVKNNYECRSIHWFCRTLWMVKLTTSLTSFEYLTGIARTYSTLFFTPPKEWSVQGRCQRRRCKTF